MVQPGVYPACTTPFDDQGRIDMVGIAKLLAFFEASGCRGAVLAGTNGEGPSLSAVEKRDLLREAMPLRGKLDLILGIATPSIHEAKWLTQQAGKIGAAAVLVMAPSYFRRASEEGIEAWFTALLDDAHLPVIIYQHPPLTGITITTETIRRLAKHPRFGGLKDSSGDAGNLSLYREAAPDHPLFVGDERLLWQALEGGWAGTISACANVIPQWLSRVALERDEVKFELIRPVIEHLRSIPQPEANKAIQHALGLINSPEPRLPLLAYECVEQLSLLDKVLGINPGNLGI